MNLRTYLMIKQAVLYTKTPEELNNQLANNALPEKVNPEYNAELQKLMEEWNANVPKLEYTNAKKLSSKAGWDKIKKNAIQGLGIGAASGAGLAVGQAAMLGYPQLAMYTTIPAALGTGVTGALAGGIYGGLTKSTQEREAWEKGLVEDRKIYMDALAKHKAEKQKALDALNAKYGIK